jgi:hypothetical protein
MQDADLRGAVLQKFYELRHQVDTVFLEDINSIEPNTRQLTNICEQLQQYGLIDWRPMETLAGVIGGQGKITARGVDVIDGTERAPISVTLHHHSITVRESSHVQIGNSNMQSVNVDLEKLIAAVDHSSASDAEKEEAKSLLERLASNRLIQLLWVAVFGGSAS